MQDMKAALGNGSKPDLTHVRTAIMTYIARACEYGSAKYQRANYMRPVGDNTPRDNFVRFRAYLRSAQSHIAKTLDAMEAHQSTDPDLVDVAGMRRAAYSADMDETPGTAVGASMLPHVAHAAAGLMMSIVQATLYGLLPDDPGQPWAALGVAPEAHADKARAKAPDVSGLCPHGRGAGLTCGRCEGGYARRSVERYG